MEFSLLFSLLQQFRAEWKSSEQNEFNAFLEWLIKHNHRRVRDWIEENTEVTLQIKHLMQMQHSELKERLDSIEHQLIKLASVTPEFRELAKATSENIGLSDQALSILEHMESTNSQYVQFYNNCSPVFSNLPTKLKIKHPEFLRDDLATLVDLKLLLCERTNSKGIPIYDRTRAGSELVKKLKKE